MDVVDSEAVGAEDSLGVVIVVAIAAVVGATRPTRNREAKLQQRCLVITAAGRLEGRNINSRQCLYWSLDATGRI